MKKKSAKSSAKSEKRAQLRHEKELAKLEEQKKRAERKYALDEFKKAATEERKVNAKLTRAMLGGARQLKFKRELLSDLHAKWELALSYYQDAYHRAMKMT